MIVTIYTLADPSNGNIRYVGRTKNNLTKRLYGHLQIRNKNGYKNSWIKSLRKKGLKPIIEALDYVKGNDDMNVWEESYALERFWICLLLSWGYNLTNLYDRGKGTLRGFKHKTRRVFCYTVDGNRITDFDSINDAADYCGTSYKNIQSALKRHSLVQKKYRFSYNDCDILPIRKRKNFRIIYQYDLSGHLINTYENKHSMEGLNVKLIREACTGRLKSHNNFIWSYSAFREKNRKKHGRRIVQYTTDMELIKIWNNYHDIKEYYPNFNENVVRAVCSGHKKTYKKYIWKYEK